MVWKYLKGIKRLLKYMYSIVMWSLAQTESDCVLSFGFKFQMNSIL